MNFPTIPIPKYITNKNTAIANTAVANLSSTLKSIPAKEWVGIGLQAANGNTQMLESKLTPVTAATMDDVIKKYEPVLLVAGISILGIGFAIGMYANKKLRKRK